MSDNLPLWEALRQHIHPAEVDRYARSVGLSRISRNEDAFSELSMLRNLQYSLRDALTAEVEKKNPPILISPQRSAAIKRAIAFLDSLREKGHIPDPTCPDDTQIMKYLRLSKASARPNSADRTSSRLQAGNRAARSVCDATESFEDIQKLLDEEYVHIQNEIQALRCELFTTADEIEEVRGLEPPPTAAIETFTKRLQTKDFVLKSMTQAKSSPVAKLRDSVRLNRLWE
jgi:hypothetical protein